MRSLLLPLSFSVLLTPALAQAQLGRRVPVTPVERERPTPPRTTARDSSARAGELRLHVPGKPWRVSMQLPGFAADVERDSLGGGVTISAHDPRTRITARLYVEPTREGWTPGDHADQLLASKRTSGCAISRVRQSSHRDVARLQYVVDSCTGLPADLMSLHAIRVHDGTWIDAEVTQPGARTKDLSRLRSMLASVRIEGSPGGSTTTVRPLRRDDTTADRARSGVSSATHDLVLDLPDADWAVWVHAPGFTMGRAEELPSGGISQTARLVREQVEMTVFLEPVGPGVSTEDYGMRVIQGRKQHGLWPVDLAFDEGERGMLVLSYRVKELDGRPFDQTHLHGLIIHDEAAIDVSFTKVDGTRHDREIFKRILRSVRIRRK
ncbi:MAG: hypothetical protein AAF533_12850 [Acidobacteriota bacterium]